MVRGTQATQQQDRKQRTPAASQATLPVSVLTSVVILTAVVLSSSQPVTQWNILFMALLYEQSNFFNRLFIHVNFEVEVSL